MSRSFRHERTLPFAPEQIFSLVADIERYPEFLEGWKRARVLGREGKTLHVEQDMSIAGIPLPMRTSATLNPPHGLVIESTTEARIGLRITWSFRPVPRGCEVRLEIELLSAPLPLSMLLPLAFEKLGPRVVKAFERRARDVLPGI